MFGLARCQHASEVHAQHSNLKVVELCSAGLTRKPSDATHDRSCGGRLQKVLVRRTLLAILAKGYTTRA